MLTSCGINNNLSISTTNGSCANNIESAPYCLSVKMQNNGGGQNFVNSTVFPINNFSIAVSGVNNINSPANSSSLDPNGCFKGTLKPGATCSFYLQIVNESYPVNTIESITIALNYSINNTAFGNSNNTYTTNLHLTESTTLYIVQNNANNSYLWQYNANGLTSSLIESTDQINTFVADTNSYGFLYLGGNHGLYYYGNGFTSTSLGNESSIGNNGVNNIIQLANYLYATTSTSQTSGIWALSLVNQKWNSTITTSSGIKFNNNINAYSPSALQFYSNGNDVYTCTTNTSTNSCSKEGLSLASNITSIGFLPGTNPPFSGLYVGTSLGLYVESGTIGTNTTSWQQITNITNSVTDILYDNISNIYVGDNAGNIWIISKSNPLNATLFLQSSKLPSNSSISALAIDNVGQSLYFTIQNGNNNSLYNCALSSCSPNLLGSLTSGYSTIGMAIASTLSTN